MAKSSFAQNSAYILLCSIAFACSPNRSDESVFKELESGISESNKLFVLSNENLLYTLEAKKNDVITKEKAAVWYPKAQKISGIARNQVAYLEDLKQRITKNNKREIQEDFVVDTISKQLRQQLADYCQRLLAVDAKLTSELSQQIKAINTSSLITADPSKYKADDFSWSNPREFLAFLSKLQNDVLRTENKCLMFCLDQITYICDLEFEVFEALVGQNAKILRVGDDLEITAGLGAFRKSKSPIVTVGNKQVALNESGIAHYKIKTARKVGKYSVPVTVAFVDQDGKQVEQTFEIEYTLVDSIRKQ